MGGHRGSAGGAVTQSAAELHDLKLTPINQVVVTVPLRCTNRFRDVVVHQSIDLVREFITEISGLPVTTLPRTIMDLAAVLRPTPLTVMVESAIVDRKVTLGEVVDHHALLGRKGKPGTRRLREVLEVVGPEVVRSESALELRMMQLLEDVGFPLPVQQLVLTWRTKTVGRVDLAYPDHRLLIELDGRRWHTTAAAFEADRRRDNLAQLAGWRVLRFTWEDVDRNPAGVISIVKRPSLLVRSWPPDPPAGAIRLKPLIDNAILAPGGPLEPNVASASQGEVSLLGVLDEHSVG